MLPALNKISDQQGKPTQKNQYAITNILDYAATNPTVIFQYKSSDTILHIDSDASHLPKPRAHSRTEGH